eukprot:4076002-Prorocentrum_lima.AAC.1
MTPSSTPSKPLATMLRQRLLEATASTSSCRRLNARKSASADQISPSTWGSLLMHPRQQPTSRTTPS